MISCRRNAFYARPAGRAATESRLNLKGLRLLRQIVLTGSLADASAALNLSSSAASRLLQQLEHELGIRLFSREKRQLALTEEGQLFYDQIVNTLIALDEIPTVLRDIKRRTKELLSIVTAAPLANGIAVPAVARMMAAGEELDCTINVETRFQTERKVAARTYNLGLISLPIQHAIIALDVMPFLQARVAVLLPADHPLAGCDAVPLDAIAEERFISLAPGQRWRDRAEALVRNTGVPFRTSVETGSTLVTVELVRAGLGITLLDRVCAPPLLGEGLVLRPLAEEHWTTYASVHPPGTRSPLFEPFLDAAVAHIADLCAREPLADRLLRLI